MGRNQRDESEKIILLCPARTGSQGATGTWSIANNTGVATCAAAQTAATFCIPVTSLQMGDEIAGFTISGQLESGGNTATVDADLRVTTAAAADLTDASVVAITQISKTADYLINDASAACSQIVGGGQCYYILVTVTTAADTDVAIQGAQIIIYRKYTEGV